MTIGLFTAALVAPLLAVPATASTVPIADACPQRVPDAEYDDVSGSFETEINCVTWWNVAQGTGTGFEPRRAVSREQMATFVARTIRESGGSLPSAGSSPFRDVSGGTHGANILALHQAGVVQGVSAREFDRSRAVTREQMASFIARAWEHRTGSPLPDGPDQFSDVSGTHADNINRLARAGITQGTGGSSYDPRAAVTRGQMAAFLARTLAKLVADGHAERPPLPAYYLTDGTWLDGRGNCSRTAATVDGEPFPRSLRCSMRTGNVLFADYDLGRSYTRFQASVGIDDTSRRTDGRMRFIVYGDGRELGRYETRFGERRNVSVDVTGVLRLKLEIEPLEATNSGLDNLAAWGDPRVR